MKANWQKVPQSREHPGYAGLYVSLNAEGQINMSRVTHDRLGGPEAVELYFDPANNRIGVKPCAKSIRDAYLVGRGSKCGGRRVNALRLLNKYAIDLPATVRFYDAEIDQDGFLVLDLRTARVPPSVLARNRRDKNPKLPAKHDDAARRAFKS